MVDNTLLYNGFNSYEMASSERLWGKPVEVDLYSHITLQAVVIRLDGTAQGRFELRWLDTEGKKIGEDTIINFDVGTKWNRKTATVTVPETAVKVIPCIYNMTTDKWHISCPMLEAGEIASAFDASLAERVSWHDATGSYVGFLRADQIVAGVLRAIAGDSGFDLEEPRIWMTSADGEVTWEATPENPLTIKDKFGQFVAGIIKVGEQYGLTSQFISNTSDLSGGFANIGLGIDGGAGIEFRRGANKFIFSFSGTGGNSLGVSLYVNGKQMQHWSNDGSQVIFDGEGNGRLAINADGNSHILDKTGQRLSIYNNGDMFMQHGTGHSIGVDASGPYYRYNGTLKRLV